MAAQRRGATYSHRIGADSALIQLEGHGREELFDGVDLTRTVGWFTAVHPVVVTTGSAPAHRIGELVKAGTREMFTGAPLPPFCVSVNAYLGAPGIVAALEQGADIVITTALIPGRDAPILWTRGDAGLLNRPCVAIVGARIASAGGQRIARGLAQALGLGSIIGYLVAGLAIGPYGLGLVKDPEAILHFAEFGVVMLIYLKHALA